MKRILLTSLLVLAPLSAQAFSVKNMTEQPWVIEIQRTAGDAVQTVKIEPFRTYHSAGKAYVRVQGKDPETTGSKGFMGGLTQPGELGIFAYSKDMLAIWKDGSIAPQIRRGKGIRY